MGPIAVVFAALAVGAVLLAKKASAPPVAATPFAAKGGEPSIVPSGGQGKGGGEGPPPAAGAWYGRDLEGRLFATPAGLDGLRAAMKNWTGLGPVKANDGAVDGYLFLPRADGAVTLEGLMSLAGSAGRLVVVDTLDMDAFRAGTHDPTVPAMVGIVAPSDLPKLLSYENDAGQSAKDLLVVVG